MSKVRVIYNSENKVSNVEVIFPKDIDERAPTTEGNDERDVTQSERLDKKFRVIHNTFVNSSESNLFVVPFVIMTLIGLIAKIMNVDVKECLEQHGEKVSEIGSISEFDIDFEKFNEFNSIMDRFKSANHTMINYTKGIIIQLSTQFDILVAGIVGQIVAMKPSVLEVSERKIDFSDLKKYENLEHLKQFFIDKAIDSVVRKNRSEQFAWIGDKLGITLTKDLEGWSEFIEINERRNLFTHTEGRITKEYIENCVAAGSKKDKLGNVGDRLNAQTVYLERANELFFIIGTKLIQVI